MDVFIYNSSLSTVMIMISMCGFGVKPRIPINLHWPQLLYSNDACFIKAIGCSDQTFNER